MKHRLQPGAGETGAPRGLRREPENLAADVVIGAAAGDHAVERTVRPQNHAVSRIARVVAALKVVQRPEDPARAGARQLKDPAAAGVSIFVATTVALMTAGRS